MLGTPRRNTKFGTKSSSVVSSVRFERVSVFTYAGSEGCYMHHKVLGAGTTLDLKFN